MKNTKYHCSINVWLNEYINTYLGTINQNLLRIEKCAQSYIQLLQL